MDRAAIDERGFEVVRRIRENQSEGTLSAFKATVREQFDMLLIDTEAALAAIPSMLPDDAATRQRAFDLICEVLSARGQHSSEDLKRIRRIGGLFDTERPIERPQQSRDRVRCSRGTAGEGVV